MNKAFKAITNNFYLKMDKTVGYNFNSRHSKPCLISENMIYIFSVKSRHLTHKSVKGHDQTVNEAKLKHESA